MVATHRKIITKKASTLRRSIKISLKATGAQIIVKIKTNVKTKKITPWI